MDSHEIGVSTAAEKFADLTAQVNAFCQGKGDGLLSVFAPHSTLGLALMEVGSGSEQDLEVAIRRLLPRDAAYGHQHGSPGHGADHLLPALLSPSLVIPVLAGHPALGTWQSIVLVDLNPDNPERKVRLSFLRSTG